MSNRIYSFFHTSPPTVLNYFDSCPELQNLALALESLRKKSEALATAAQQSKIDSLDNKKCALVKGILDDLDERVHVFNKEYKETSTKTELERQLNFCLGIRNKLSNILTNSFQLKTLNARRDSKKTAVNIATALAALSATIAAGVVSGGWVALGVWSGFNVSDMAIRKITNMHPIDTDTVTILLSIKGTADATIKNIEDLISKAATVAPSVSGPS